MGVEVMKYLSKILTVLLFTLGAQAALADDITFIDQCGVSSSANNETLIVTSDIQGSGYCIFILHENVTLDCQGYVLSARQDGGAYGIRIFDEAHYVTVRNCILDFWFFAFTSQGDWGLIEHNEIIDGGFGMVFSGDGNEVRHNKIMGGSWVGMDFHSNSDNNLIHHNSVHDKPGGMFIRHSSSNDIFHNIITNSGIGIFLDDESNSNNVIGNRTNNGRTGIFLSESYENLVADNVANKNAIGIEETGEELDNTYEDNVCKANETVDSNIDGACK